MKQFIHILSFIFIFTNSLLAQKVLTLEDAISIALRESHTIKSAQYSLMSSQKNLESIRLGLMTSVSLELDAPKYSRTLSSQFNPSIGSEEFFKIGNTTIESRLYFTQPIIFTNGTLSIVGSMFGRDQFSEVKGTTRDYFSNLSLRLRQPLFTFNTQKANLERAELNLEKARRNYTKAEMDLIYNVTSSFYDLYQLKENVKITEEKVNQTELSYKTASNKFKAGLIAEVEAMQLEVDLVTAKNELLSAKMRYEEEKDNFKLLIGLALTDEIDIQAEISYKPVEIDTALAIDNALKNRPELLNSEIEIKLSEMSVDEVDSKGNIRADLVANYGINKNDERLKDIFNQFDENRSVTLTFSL
ncbi:MAG: TolC family protein, partial [Ignavibacteria bacterium]|nr:TolC family protein [Ignavibacteria bacterium]